MTDNNAYLEFLRNYKNDLDENWTVLIWNNGGSYIRAVFSLGTFYYDTNDTSKAYCTNDIYLLYTTQSTGGRTTNYRRLNLTDSEKNLSSSVLSSNLSSFSQDGSLRSKNILSLSDNSILAEKNCFVFDPPEPEEPDEPTTNTTTEYYDYTEHFEDIENKLYYMLHFYMTFDCLLLSIIVYLFLHFMLERRKI